MRTGSRRHRISTVFQIPGRRADSLRIGRYTNFLDITANGILDGDVSTSNMDEGRIQQLAFSKADSRYLIADSSKIGKRDFYTFCRRRGTALK